MARTAFRLIHGTLGTESRTDDPYSDRATQLCADPIPIADRRARACMEACGGHPRTVDPRGAPPKHEPAAKR